MNEQNAMKPYVIGLDLGGTNSVFGIVDARGEIKATTAIKTKAYDNEEDYVNASIDALHIIIDQVGGIEKIKANIEANAFRPAPKWLEYDANNQMAKVVAVPARDDIDLPIEEHLIVELYSK